MSKLNSFNSVASFYDALAHVVFAGNIKRAQLFFLKAIPHGSSVLVIGGGTGWIVKEIFRRVPQVTILFVEGSSRMIDLTRERLDIHELKRVTFIHATEAPVVEKVDVVITNFLLDLFTEERLSSYIKELQHIMKPTTRWLVTDFVNEGKLWQRFLLWVMYSFFRQTGAIENDRLPDWEQNIRSAGYNQSEARQYFCGFIKTTVYRPST